MAVLTGDFLCPKCGAKLRINERGKKSAQIDCPECGDQIEVKLSSTGKLIAFLPGERPSSGVRADEPLWERRKRDHFPIFLGGIVLLTLVLSGLWWIGAGGGSRNSPDTMDSPAKELAEKGDQIANAEKPKKPSEKDTSSSSSSVNGISESHAAKKVSGGDSVFVRNLKLLGQQVEIYRSQHDSFPPALWPSDGNVPSIEDRFSWLAGLDPALKKDHSLLPQWNLSWRDPLNDRFVRRRRKELLNPSIRLQVSPDHYPASNIVGIAGVGHDAPRLPANDPRAGIFGIDRTTKVTDVTDGLSNTMLAAGITGKVSSWADGSASFRPFVLEPYINGPDGFGSGQKNGMPVLMADGSVRFLNKETEPTIIRRMAAMADALPLDASVPGEPGSKNIVLESAAKQSEKNIDPKRMDAPVSPPDDRKKVDESKKATTDENNLKADNSKEKNPPVEQTPSIDFEKSLSRKVLKFELIHPAPLESVLVELEAMIGVRIDFDQQQIGADDDIRRFKVGFSKRNVSFRELLTELLKPASLRYEISKDRIVIRKKE